jgi:hypothetical protein
LSKNHRLTHARVHMHMHMLMHIHIIPTRILIPPWSPRCHAPDFSLSLPCVCFFSACKQTQGGEKTLELHQYVRVLSSQKRIPTPPSAPYPTTTPSTALQGGTHAYVGGGTRGRGRGMLLLSSQRRFRPMAFVVCLYAIIGVAFFSQKSQERFATWIA